MSPSGGGETARLFVALELPSDVMAELERWRAGALPEAPGIRPVAREALHATLCFLGWRDLDEIEPIATACEVALRGERAPELSLADPVWLPAYRPRVLALGIEDASGRLARVQAAVSEALTAGGWYAPEARPFVGHVTVARLGRAIRIRGIELPAAPAARFVSRSVTLFRSRLGRGGARYEALRTVRLG